jgi:hypothetical protein
MTIRLSAEDSATWGSGGWLSLEIPESIVEDLDRQRCTEVTVVCLADGTVIFAVSAGEVI